jgi:hypothetical protein
MAAFIPGASPPEVRIPIHFTVDMANITVVSSGAKLNKNY